MLERVIREGCPFFVGMERVFFLWGGALLGRRGFCWGGRGMSVWRMEMSVGERECPSGGGECLSGKSVSPVSAQEGYLGGVVGESAAKRGYESPAPLQGIACGGHSGDSDFPDGCHMSTNATEMPILTTSIAI